MIVESIIVLASFICGVSLAQRQWIGVVLGLATLIAAEAEKALS